MIHLLGTKIIVNTLRFNLLVLQTLRLFTNLYKLTIIN